MSTEIIKDRVLTVVSSRYREAKQAAADQEAAAADQEALDKAIEELRRETTPSTITNYWRTRLQVDGRRVGLDIQVPDCNWTQKAINEPMLDILGSGIPGLMVYKPSELSGRLGLADLDRMYPGKQNKPFRVGVTTEAAHNEDKKIGWIKVEATITSPNLKTTWQELESHAARSGYLRQAPSTYILASRGSQDLFGAPFDKNLDTASRLLGGFCGSNGRVYDYNHEGPYYMDMVWDWYMTTSDGRDGALGGRFEATL